MSHIYKESPYGAFTYVAVYQRLWVYAMFRARMSMLEEYYQMSTSATYKKDIARASKREVSAKDLYK